MGTSTANTTVFALFQWQLADVVTYYPFSPWQGSNRKRLMYWPQSQAHRTPKSFKLSICCQLHKTFSTVTDPPVK
jgi:hypothetical protein